jgi:PAB-dependent poly(A)-specific ribonuclease subunit 3
MNLCAAITNHVMDEVTTMYAVADGLETHLASEYDNGRLLKIMLKLGCVNERPEYQMNERWSETGDRYMLKLFRNYLFHQVDEEGAPVTDVGHMVHSLNKLDAGDPEQMLLASPDGESVLVVSFADMKRCLEASFGEL